ncbi:MAG: vitamin B12-dependent ribonucleotide reductase [Nitrososphaerota archaeon]|nr:vitamin B12-dependent ribonucleotide reductase [Nitrososphaerales archaeon]MDW8045288.1 vitamin B12-dependent ribonucleotide reductase [Nitrososphaerota archaeon]
MVVSSVRKRDGRIEPFQEKKIADAILKAFNAVGRKDGEVSKELARQVTMEVEKNFAGKIPSVEDIQDIVERVLIKNGFDDVSKAYILYRKKRSEVREAKRFFGVEDDLKLSVNAISVLEKRYLLKDLNGKVIETPSQMFRRVARAVALAEKLYGYQDVSKFEDEFYTVMRNLEFIPNSPTLMNAGTEIGQLSACFVLPVEDSIKGIFDAIKYMALIHQSGGGTGFSFSNLRPRGDIVRSTRGVASGPVSFMKVFDAATEVIKQGGKRRGANMGVLRVDHPDIIEFITVKSRIGVLNNFNISVAVTDEFMEKVFRGEDYDLINPRNGEVVGKLNASEVFNLMATMAWSTGDPGIIFIDEINRHNPTPSLGRIESTNPCGEQPLLPYESCNLGSINLAKMVKDGDLDWDRLREVVRIGVRMLDDVIDVNKYPLPQIEELTKGNRKIGLGVMGFADMLVQLGVRYDSDEGLRWAEKVMKFISDEARKTSVELAEEKGSFPNFEKSVWKERGYDAMRNATLTTIAPTGTISIIAGCTNGIEPIFAISFIRNVLEGTRLLEVNPYFEAVAKERGFYSEELMREIAKRGSIQNIKGIPEDVKNIFVTAFDIAPEWHVKMQAAFQKYVDNAVSKTVNLPREASVEDVKKIFILAYKLKCKGITVYRYGSKPEQVLYIGSELRRERGDTLEFVGADSEYSGGCPTAGICNIY